MRNKLLLGNWKMNKTTTEAKEFAAAASSLLEIASAHHVDIGVAPSFLSLEAVRKALPASFIVSAQNVNEHDHGAYTGEVSIPMLKDIGIDWAIIGHSERRSYNAETSLACNAKIKALLAACMTPVYCLGESLETFEKGETKAFVSTQLKEGLKDLTPEEARKVIIAYEPIWAIGTGKSATKEIAEDVIGFIRRTLREHFGPVSEDIRILYGGSVKPNNVREYMECPNIDGALVGGASLNIDSYRELLEGMI